MNSKKCWLAACSGLFLAACASSGVVSTGQGSYIVTKQSAGGIFVPGETIKPELYKEAGEFCGNQGKEVETINATAKNAIPFARMSSAELQFRCVEKAAAQP